MVSIINTLARSDSKSQDTHSLNKMHICNKSLALNQIKDDDDDDYDADEKLWKKNNRKKNKVHMQQTTTKYKTSV